MTRWGKNFFIFMITAMFCLFCRTVFAYSVSTDNTQLTLYTNGVDEVIAHFKMYNGWHIYWQNPGDIGRPTRIKAQNGSVQVVNQSVPEHHIAYEIMHEYLYNNEAYFSLYLPKIENVVLNFSFVECRDECKPQHLQIALNDVSESSSDEWKQVKTAAEATFPTKIKLVSPLDDNEIVLKNIETDMVHFVPASRHVVQNDSVIYAAKGKKWLISWLTEDNKRLSQALLLTPEKAYLADIVYVGHQMSLLYILLLAFIGGIILNAMPCVFPVLSLKIFALLQNKQLQGRWQRALSYTLGVLCSFLLLTVLLVFFKQQGEAVGWGFQLQSPWFVGLMALIFLLLFASMLEWLHFPSFANDFIHRAAGLNDFSTGFFAVLIASPCTGPFMGAAVGYAFLQDSSTIFAVFTALALGYALPYALIELYPQTLAKWLPKPGIWMRHVKILLSIPILLTSLWLFWVFAAQMHASMQVQNEESLHWHTYNSDKIEKLSAKGENIFIDFTAKWCLTCQFNDKMLLQSEHFKDFVKKNKVHLFKADLTEDNDIYNAALSAYGRDGIPVYIYYQKGTFKILPIFFSISELQE